MRKYSLFFLSVCLLTLMLSSCGGDTKPNESKDPNGQSSADIVSPSTKLNAPPKENQIVSDLNTYGVDALKESGAVITGCEIIKRQSNPDNKEDIVFCKATGESNISRVEYQFKLLYNFYDEGGWILDEVSPEKEDEWTAVYLDAAGNDIMDDILWLDALADPYKPIAFYIGEYNGVHYFARDDQVEIGHPNQHYYRVYDQSGNLMCDKLFSVFDAYYAGLSSGLFGNGETVINVFLNESGEARIVYRSNEDYNEHLIDSSGQELCSHRQIFSPDSDAGLCLVADLGEWDDTYGDYMYGAIDFNGNLVVPCEYREANDVIPNAFNTAVPPSDYQDLNISAVVRANSNIYIRGAMVNGAYLAEFRDRCPDIIDTNGDPVISMPYDKAVFDNADNLIAVFNGVRFQLYDLNGRCRSPEFEIGATADIYRYKGIVVNHNGRYGLLPQITSDDEKYYFRYSWGPEHLNAK